MDFHSKALNIDGADFNVSFWDIVGADKAGSVAKVLSFVDGYLVLYCYCYRRTIIKELR